MVAENMNILVLSQINFNNAQTVIDHVFAFVENSRHRIFVLPWMGAFPADLDLGRFDVLVFHYSSAPYHQDFLVEKDRKAVREFKGLKVAFRQDEYQQINRYHEMLNDLGIDLLYTCIPQDYIETVYPRERLPKLKKINTLTGYIPQSLLDYPKSPLAFRKTGVGYRSRQLAYWYGDLAYEKIAIAEMFQKECEPRGISSDICVSEKSRLYGQPWIEFISNCRCMLGTESGANILDFDGSMEETWNRLTGNKIGSDGVDFSYESYCNEHLADKQNLIKMNQISPRVFEAAAMKTALVLFEGEYSGIIKPWQHFIPVKKDGSNLDEVFAAIKDLPRLQEMADRTYNEVACNPAYGYPQFVAQFDQDVDAAAIGKIRTGNPYDNEEFTTLLGSNDYVDIRHWVAREKQRDPRFRRPYNLDILPALNGKISLPGYFNIIRPLDRQFSREKLGLYPLTIEVTNRCNMRCIMCVSHGAKLYQGQSDHMPAFIDVDFFKDVVMQYKHLKQDCGKAILPQFQGEPLLHPRFLELCEFIDSQDINFGFTTNAQLLKPEISHELLKFKNFTHLSFSLDGADAETYETIRVGANYEKVVGNISAFLEEKKKQSKSIITAISCTEQPINKKQVLQIAKMWAPKVNTVSVNHLAVDGRPRDFHWYADRIPCGDLWHFMVVLTNGQVSPCCRDYLYKFDLGNIKDSSLEAIWTGPEYENLRKLHLAGKWNQNPTCADCDTWMCRTPKREYDIVDNNLRLTKGPFFKLYEDFEIPGKELFKWIDWEYLNPSKWRPAASDTRISSTGKTIKIGTNGRTIEYQAICSLPGIERNRRYAISGTVTFKGDNSIRLGVANAAGTEFLTIQNISGSDSQQFYLVFNSDSGSDGAEFYVNNNNTGPQVISLSNMLLIEVPIIGISDMLTIGSIQKYAPEWFEEHKQIGILPRQKVYKVLYLANFQTHDAQTIIDHCESFSKYSQHDYYYVDPVGRPFPDWVDINDFDIIVIHYSIYTICYSYLDSSWINFIRNSRAYKIMFIQDEYRKVHEFTARMRSLGIDLLYTCVPEHEISRVYSEQALPGVLKVNNLTGYVPEYLEKERPDFDSQRPLDVGYRGRNLGFWYGELGQEKTYIAVNFLKHAKKTDLKCDISYFEEDRIYGDAWLKFLRSCRCTLGTESGASVFDFTGHIETKVRAYLQNHPDARFEDVREMFFKDEDGQISLNQISPRMFEAIGTGLGLVLFEGEYSGILKPDVHFIPLKKDFSNFDEVAAKIKDKELVRNMTKRAYDDIVASGKYSYRTFINDFDRKLDEIAVDFAVDDNRPIIKPKPVISRVLTFAWSCKIAMTLTKRIAKIIAVQAMLAAKRIARKMRKNKNKNAEKRSSVQSWNFLDISSWIMAVPNAKLESTGTSLLLSTNGHGVDYQTSARLEGAVPNNLYRLSVTFAMKNQGSFRIGILNKSQMNFIGLFILSGDVDHEKTQEFTFMTGADDDQIVIVLCNYENPKLTAEIKNINIKAFSLMGRIRAIVLNSMLPYLGRTDHPFFQRNMFKLLKMRFSK